MSTLGIRDGEVKQNSYIYEAEDKKYAVNGYGQLEPVPKMLARKLYDKKQKLDLIIILASEETKKPKEPFETVSLDNKEGQVREPFENVSAIEFFIHQIHKDSFCKNTKFFVIDSEDEKTAIRKAADQLRSIHDKNQNMNLYVDMHGGPRTNQLLVDAILSLLKMDGIYVKDAFNVPGGGKDAKIENALDAVRMFDFVSGMNEFISYGFGKGILRYVNQQGEFDKKYKGFVDCIKKISDALLLCDVTGFEKALDELNVMKLENRGGNEAYIDMFIENIKKDYGDLLDPKKRTLLKEIEWAQGKDFYQQCLAIIEAKTPEFVFRKFISYNEKSIPIEKNGEKITLQQFYKEVHRDRESERSCIAKALLYSREFRHYEDTGKSFKYNNCWKLEHGLVKIYVTYVLYNKQQRSEYKIKFATNLTQKDTFKAFVDIWRELKRIRNDVMHVNDKEGWTIEEVDERIDRYRSYYDVLNKNVDYVLARIRK